jgi:hypothetical protein
MNSAHLNVRRISPAALQENAGNVFKIPHAGFCGAAGRVG